MRHAVRSFVLLLLATGWLIPGISHAGLAYLVMGTVRDADTNAPISGATASYNYNRSQTSSYGTFITQANKGAGTVFVSAPGYLPTALAVNVTISGNINSLGNILLKPAKDAEAPIRESSATWQAIGPFGGVIAAIAVDPKHTQTVYAATNSGGIFKSGNGGASWQALRNGVSPSARVAFIAIDPTDSQTLYACCQPLQDDVQKLGILLKSSDGGASWSRSDTGLPASYSPENIAIDPHDNRKLYLPAGGRLYQSTDGGASWLQLSTLTSFWVSSVLVDPADGQTIYAGAGSDGIFKSVDGGVSWSAINGGIPADTPISKLVMDPANRQTLYAQNSAYGGVYKSTNGGASWSAANSGIETQLIVSSLAVSPADSQIVYAASWNGFFRSADRGASWQAVNNGQGYSYFSAMAVDPGDSRTLYAGTGNFGAGMLIKSVDGGASWAVIDSGLTATGVSSMAIDPTNSQTIYAGTTGIGVFKSADAGNSWSQANAGVADESVNALVIDPADNRRLYAGGWGIYLSADGGISWAGADLGSASSANVLSLAVDPLNRQAIYTGTNIGIFKSADGGASWTAANVGLSNSYVRALALDPANSRTLYAGTGNGIFKSTDAGGTWAAASVGLTPGACVISLAIDASNPLTVYAGTAVGVYKSINGGASWSAAGSGMRDLWIYALAVDPGNYQTVYAATGDHVYKSVNGGASWIAIYNGASMSAIYSGASFATDVHVSMAVDPANPDTVYFGTDVGVFKSMVSKSGPVLTGGSSATFVQGVSSGFTVASSGWPRPVFSAAGALPDGIGFDPATGIFSGAATAGSEGSYPVLVTASNGTPPDAVRRITLAVLPASPLAVAIATPAVGAGLNSLTAITGSASGAGLDRVEVQVTDGYYYLQGDGSFGTTPAWLAAAGAGSWSLATGAVRWIAGAGYTVSARAKSGDGQACRPVASTFTIEVPVGKVATALTMSLAVGTIRAGEMSAVSGTLVNADLSPAAEQRITVVVTPPPGSSAPDPAPLTAQLTTDANGAFSTGPLAMFASAGVYSVSARFDGSATLAASFDSGQMFVVEKSGHAIIVSGRTTDGSLLELHNATTDSIYATLVNKRGFQPENIKYLKSTASAAVSKEQLQQAITSWARDQLAATPAPLYLFMVDHGTTDGFVLGDQTVTPDELGQWLKTLESDAQLLGSGAVDGYHRVIVIGACYSGAFTAKLSGQGRVVITSSAADERAIAGFSVYNSASDATFSGGDYFIDTLVNFLGRGDSFRDAFVESSSMVSLRDPRVAAAGFHSGVYDTLAQHPLLDDNGDQTGSYNLFGAADGAKAEALSLGVGKRSIGNPADIIAVAATDILPTGQTADYPLWLKVADNSRVAKAWAEIRTPNSTVATGSGSGQVIPSLVTVALYYDGDRWQNSYPFGAPGTYSILYYTQDDQSGDISPAAHSVVYRQLSGSVTPPAFTLTSPEDGSGQSTIVALAWQEVVSATPLTYTLLVSTDRNFGTVVYKEEGIPQAATYIADGKLKDPASGAYYCQSSSDTWCYWKVQAIDGYGAVAESDSRRFTTVTTNGLPGVILGYLRNGVSGGPVTNAVVKAGSRSAISLSNGGFLMVVSTGSYNVSVATAAGYQPKSLGPLMVTAGKATDASMTLAPYSSGTIGRYGDCSGDGMVTAAEVRNAIDMFLAVKSPASCVDKDGVGGVSIVEMQQVVNSYSGSP